MIAPATEADPEPWTPSIDRDRAPFDAMGALGVRDHVQALNENLTISAQMNSALAAFEGQLVLGLNHDVIWNGRVHRFGFSIRPDSPEYTTIFLVFGRRVHEDSIAHLQFRGERTRRPGNHTACVPAALPALQ